MVFCRFGSCLVDCLEQYGKEGWTELSTNFKEENGNASFVLKEVEEEENKKNLWWTVKVIN